MRAALPGLKKAGRKDTAEFVGKLGKHLVKPVTESSKQGNLKASVAELIDLHLGERQNNAL